MVRCPRYEITHSRTKPANSNIDTLHAHKHIIVFIPSTLTADLRREADPKVKNACCASENFDQIILQS